MTRSESKISGSPSSGETGDDEELSGKGQDLDLDLENGKDNLRKIHRANLKLTTTEAKRFISENVQRHVEVTITNAIQSAMDQIYRAEQCQIHIQRLDKGHGGQGIVPQMRGRSQSTPAARPGSSSTSATDEDSSIVDEDGVDAKGSSCPSAKEPLALTLITVQITLIVLFAFMVQYDDGVGGHINEEDGKNETNSCSAPLGSETKPNMVSKYYQQYQDIQVMVFLGIGVLMAFIRNYGYSAIGFTLLAGTFAVQWSIIVRGLIYNGTVPINLNLISLIYGDFAAAVVLISYGVVIGVASPLQLIFMIFSEILFYILNEYIGVALFDAVDTGGSIFVHVFAAYFGLGVSRGMRSAKAVDSTHLQPSYNSNIFCLVAVVFLWLFWPSFNSVLSTGRDQDRVVINTMLALFGSCISAFATSALFNGNKFILAHIQNASLAGGVAIGAIVDQILRPFGALTVGVLGGFFCVFGLQFISLFLTRVMGLHDSCGVHNLHGLPGILAALGSVAMAALATECEYGPNLYLRYPARAPSEKFPGRLQELQKLEPGILPGLDRSGMGQAMVQLTVLGITLLVSLVGGAVTGGCIAKIFCSLLMRLPLFRQVQNGKCFDDGVYFDMEGTNEDKEKQDQDKAKRRQKRKFPSNDNGHMNNKINPTPNISIEDPAFPPGANNSPSHILKRKAQYKF